MVCGLAILLAGGAQLVRLSRSKDRVVVLDEGQEAVVGTARAKVVSSRIIGDLLHVEVEVTPPATGGIAGETAADPWSLLAGGGLIEPRSDQGSCPGIRLDGGAAAPLVCDVVFAATAGTKTLAFRWGDVQRQWQLAA